MRQPLPRPFRSPSFGSPHLCHEDDDDDDYNDDDDDDDDDFEFLRMLAASGRQR